MNNPQTTTRRCAGPVNCEGFIYNEELGFYEPCGVCFRAGRLFSSEQRSIIEDLDGTPIDIFDDGDIVVLEEDGTKHIVHTDGSHYKPDDNDWDWI